MLDGSGTATVVCDFSGIVATPGTIAFHACTLIVNSQAQVGQVYDLTDVASNPVGFFNL